MLATPAFSQQVESQVRRAAAIADFRKSCAPQIAIYIGEQAGRSTVNTDYLFTHYRSANYNAGDNGMLMGPAGLRNGLDNEVAGAARFNDKSRLGICVFQVALRHAQEGVPGFDRGTVAAPVARSRVASKAPSPKVAVSPSALSPQQLRDQAVDAELGQAIQEIMGRYRNFPSCVWRAENAVQDPCMRINAQNNILVTEAVLARLEARRQRISAEYYKSVKTPWERARANNLDSCARLANSTTPCGQPLPGSAYGVKSRIIARDGRHALSCVKLVDTSSGNSSTSGPGRVLSNQCGGPVEVAWCSVGGECERGAGNSWTVQAGRSWPVDSRNEIRWGACHGVNTIHGEEGSKGLNFTCSKPAK